MNPLEKLINPRWPAAAVGLEGAFVAAVSLDRRRGRDFSVRAMATAPLPQGLLTPGFDEPNISNEGELADSLAKLVMNAGLTRQHRWSASLPELTARTTVIVMESAPTTRAEFNEMLNWKIERGFGAELGELRISRQSLKPDASGRARYLVTGVRLSVLAQYESVFESLGWHVGMIWPRHLCESRWLANKSTGGKFGDELLLSSHEEGFTAMIMRNKQPLLIRAIGCQGPECTDELFRLLLFYRDRMQSPVEGRSTSIIDRVLLVGEGFDPEEVSASVSDTLESKPQVMRIEDLGLLLPAHDVNTSTLIAPAGLAALKWA